MDHKTSIYDAIPYRGQVVPTTSPFHLSLCSQWNHTAARPSRVFRFVELGCGDGSNLIPLAFYHGQASFIGIDCSRGELELARKKASQLDLRNIRFILSDVRGLKSSEVRGCGYVIAHGLFSWVSEEVRDAILSICQQCLSPSGLAYVSYNAQPGWATRRLVRETLLRARSVQTASVEYKAKKAIELATVLLEDLPSRDYAFAVVLAEELERVCHGRPSYVFHEYLAEVNEGFWLRDFVAAARRHGLDYVTDAQFCRWEGHIPAELKKALAKRSLDPLEQEEAADLLCHRYFRASILCRADAPREAVSHQQILEKVHIASSLCAESDPFNLTEGVVERFSRRPGPEVTLNASITKAAVVLLAAQWPRGMQLDELYTQATGLLNDHGCVVRADARSELSNELTTLFETGQVDLRLAEPSYQTGVPECPKAHGLARYEAEHREALTTPYHLPIPFESEALTLVRELDGSRSQDELRREFGEQLVTQTLRILGGWGLLER